MADKSLLYRIFGFGKLPKKFAPTLQAEGIVLIDIGISGSVTMRKYRAPGRYCSYRKNGFVGCLLITKKRFAAFAFSSPVINVPLDHPNFSALDIRVPDPGQLTVTFAAEHFHDDRSGTIECRFNTPLAVSFKDRL